MMPGYRSVGIFEAHSRPGKRLGSTTQHCSRMKNSTTNISTTDYSDESVMRVFHPVHERSHTVWFPGDESTSILIAVLHVWEDIERLSKLRAQAQDPYDRKLLLKYVIIEVRSLIKLMDALHAKVMSATIYDEGQEPLYRGMSSKERAAARELWGRYSSAKKTVENDIIAVRNKIAAHRELSDWQVVMALWDKLDGKLISALLSTIPAAFNHTKDLNIFEWNRQPEPGVIEILGGSVGPWLFEEGKTSAGDEQCGAVDP